jgi:hypothetical protein
MGHAVADRLFWAQSVEDAADDEADGAATAEDFSLPGHQTRH